MKNTLKITKVILIFFLSLFIISFIWYNIDIAMYPDLRDKTPFIDYILYIIGYGDLAVKDHYLQTGFSIIALFTMSLLSSVFTVSLFELRSKAALMPQIGISCENDRYTANASVKTIGKDIYDVTAVLIAKIGDEIYSESVYLPFIPKKTVQKIKFSLEVGSPLYKYMRSSLEGNGEISPLIITLTYMDIESGQEYKTCAKFSYSKDSADFGYSQKDLWLDIFDYVLSKEFCIDLAKTNAINDEDICISSDMQRTMCAQVNMTSRVSYEPKNFVMACISDLWDNDWRKYADLGCHLDFDYQLKGNITVTLELKYGDANLKVYRHRLQHDNPSNAFSLDLNSAAVNYDALANVREICFTVFYEDTDPQWHSGEFLIKNCALRIPSTEKRA